MLIIKNNITGLEVVSVSGQGQWARFLLGNRKPGSSQPLLFDISEKHLKNCDSPWHSRYLFPSVTVNMHFRSFLFRFPSSRLSHRFGSFWNKSLVIRAAQNPANHFVAAGDSTPVDV